MTAIPNTVALANIADGSNIVAADHRNNYAAIQTAVNGLIADLSGGTAGQILKALSSSSVGYDTPVGGELGYTQFTASVTLSGLEGTPTDIVAAPSVAFDGTAVIVEFFCVQVSVPAAGGAIVGISLWDTTAAADLGRIAQVNTFGTAAGGVSVLARRKITPAAGARIYTVRGWQAGAGNGTALAGAGGAGVALPGYIRITKA